jgi:hypothetical protein
LHERFHVARPLVHGCAQAADRIEERELDAFLSPVLDDPCTPLGIIQIDRAMHAHVQRLGWRLVVSREEARKAIAHVQFRILLRHVPGSQWTAHPQALEPERRVCSGGRATDFHCDPRLQRPRLPVNHGYASARDQFGHDIGRCLTIA